MDEIKSFAVFLLVFAGFLQFTVAKEIEVRALVGGNALLPCRVDVNQCGTLHSVKWYKDTSRIYVFSQAGQIRRAEGDATERMNMTYNEARNETFLQISPVKVDDEATYKCEITYLEVVENCDVIQIVKLTTLVKPSNVILTYNGNEINESTSLEEKIEGDDVVLICKALGGKPIPTVSWYNGTQLINRASYSARSDGNTTGTGISKLQLTLSKYDLNKRFECKVESQALEEPITKSVTLPVKVKPTKIKLSGVNGHVNQGTIVSLICEVFGARPMAEVEWFNSTTIKMVTNTSRGIEVRTVYELDDDGTYTTKSTLSFPATRFEHGKRFECYGKNEVTVIENEPNLYEPKILDVRYPPVIEVGAIGNTVVNESANITLTCRYFANPQKLEGATWIKDGKNLTKTPGKHRGGDIEMPSLTIRGITREDAGDYSCLLQNAVNSSLSEDIIYVDVHYPPDVEVVMTPSTPANATEQTNITLECNVTSGNPPSLRKVRWFLDGELMAELPECNYSQPLINDTIGGPFCGIDPSILSLIKVEQTFAGNYTCQGENDAGLGPVSEPQELIVYYPPSAARLTHYPPTIMKGGQVTLTCSVDDTGFPTNVTYLWFRNGHMIHNITVSNWTIPHASLETRSNFTCIALNKGGQSKPAYDFVNVEAPPAVITKASATYKGVLYSSQNMSLSCQIECFPRCSIKWYKDGHEINFKNNILYYVINTNHSADYKTNDFESIESTLVWNMTNWPGRQLNKSSPDSYYTCASYDPPDRHRVGVNFSTAIGVEYPPENLTVSHSYVNVIEDEPPTDVKCSGDGRPNLNYVWKRNFTSEPIVKSDTLKLPKMSRTAAGYYVCEAYNRHGNKTILVKFNVWYKPECKIERGDIEYNSALICKADGNPSDMTFTWMMIEQNKTSEINPSGGNANFSYFFLDSSVTTEVEYQCVANNSIKASDPCSIKIPGSKLPWYFTKENLIVIIASIITLIICFIVVCIVIIVLCRKKRQNTKSPNPSSTGDKTRLGAAPPVGGLADPANDHGKGFYENLPFHGMQNPPNKPISVIAPFTQETRNFQSLTPKTIQRHQSFHGFQNNQQIQHLTNFSTRFDLNRSNPFLNNFHKNFSFQQVNQPFTFRNNFQPILNFNPFLLPNPFSIPPNRVAGRREENVRRTASGINITENKRPNIEKKSIPNTDDNDKRFSSLELKKHKCYSPTFYSMRCKKHAKKRPVVYALPKKVFGDLNTLKKDSDNSESNVPIPAPRSRKCAKKEVIYQNTSQSDKPNSPSQLDVSSSSVEGSENLESEVSVIQAQVHNDAKPETDKRSPLKPDESRIIKVEAMKALKNSPMLKVSPNFIKPKIESPKGALSLQIQAKMKNSNDNLNQADDSSKENLPLIPQMPLLNPRSPDLVKSQNAFYTLTTPHYKHVNVGLPPQYSATIPHQKHTKLLPRNLFNEPLPKSKSFSSKPKHKKHFQIPLQKCHSFKFQTAESYFQPIRNIHEEDLMKNGYVSDYPSDGSRTRHHKREKPKQKTKGPLVVMRPSEYHGGMQFPESVQSSVQLQYPQPVLGNCGKKPNGVVYADLDMPKTNNKKGSHDNSSFLQNKTQKSKPKTEYATLSFNDVGQEIDV